jgi:hypothetical protein
MYSYCMKLSHGRPSTLDGEYYAHMFIHFRPVGWNYRNADRWVVIRSSTSTGWLFVVVLALGGYS